MESDTMEVVLTIKKADLPKIIDTLGITEYHFKDSRVTADLTGIFKEAQKELADKPAESSVY